MKKYELTDETLTFVISYKKKTLHRIRALTDFGNVKTGQLGGWVESEGNLSQQGLCWVGGQAKVSGDARVLRDAQVSENSRVSGSA